MTNDGWGSKWPVNLSVGHIAKIKEFKEAVVNSVTISEGIFKIVLTGTAINKKWQNEQAIARAKFMGVDLGSDDRTVLSKGNFHTTLHKESSNLIDDEQKLYFQCSGCHTLFDPDTKSFKTLHDKAKEAGWKVKWNEGGQGYKVYCEECKSE